MGIKKEMILYFLQKLSDNTLGDYSFFEDIEQGKIKFSDPLEQEKLEKFIKDLLVYEEPCDARKMLQDIKWQEIVKQAEEVGKLLEKIDF